MDKVYNIGGLILGILGLATGIYFHYSTIDSRELSYTRELDAYKIYDKALLDKSQAISLYKNDSVKITENVYVTSIAIWNSGNLPIDIKDVRKDIEIKLNGLKSILDYRIVKQSDSSISRFVVQQIKGNQFGLKWRYFDPGDGLRLQIIYTGSPSVATELEGKILSTDFRAYTPFRKQERAIPTLIIVSFGIIITIVAGLGLLRRFRRPGITREYPTFKEYLLSGRMILVIITVIMYGIAVPWYYYNFFFETANIPY